MARWLAVLLLVGCTEGGQRSQTGDCPAGESCSPATPDGLFFLGSALAENPLGRGEPLPVALGGTQSVRLLTGSTSTSPSFTLPFSALSSGIPLGIAGVTAPEVTVQGMALGSAFLRIVEPGTELLYDRVQVDVHAIATSDLKPRNYLNPVADADFAANPGRWVLLAGGTETCVARLFDAGGARVADESLTMSVVAGGGLTAGARDSWDTLGLTASGTGTGQVAVRTGDGVTRDGAVTIVNSVDNIVFARAQGAAQTADQGVPAGVVTTFCFRAIRGTDLVAGVTFMFSASLGLTTSVAAGTNCVGVMPTQPGVSLLTVRGAGLTRDFTINVGAF